MMMAESDRELEASKRELADAIAAVNRSRDRRTLRDLDRAMARARRVAGGHSGRYTPPSTRRR